MFLSRRWDWWLHITPQSHQLASYVQPLQLASYVQPQPLQILPLLYFAYATENSRIFSEDALFDLQAFSKLLCLWLNCRNFTWKCLVHNSKILILVMVKYILYYINFRQITEFVAQSLIGERCSIISFLLIKLILIKNKRKLGVHSF